MNVFNNIKLHIRVWNDTGTGELVCCYCNQGDDLNKPFKEIHSEVPEGELDSFYCYNSKDTTVYLVKVPDKGYVEIRYPGPDHLGNNRILPTINHKLRTPLTDIIGMLSMTDNWARGNEHMESILQKAVYSLICLANDITDLINIDNSSIKTHPKKVNISRLVDSIYNDFLPECQTKNINLTLEIENNVPTSIYLDEAILSQILRILIHNAIDHTIIGKVRICISIDKSKVLFTVKDTGTGIKDTELEEIKNQLNSSSRFLKFNGFGLYIASHIAPLINATIKVNSITDMGSIFVLTVNPS